VWFHRSEGGGRKVPLHARSPNLFKLFYYSFPSCIRQQQQQQQQTLISTLLQTLLRPLSSHTLLLPSTTNPLARHKLTLSSYRTLNRRITDSIQPSEMSSRGGRGGARGGGLMGATWDFDPDETLQSKPSALFPVRPPIPQFWSSAQPQPQFPNRLTLIAYN
jgi:hypothetical protein